MFLISLFAACRSSGFLLFSNLAKSYKIDSILQYIWYTCINNLHNYCFITSEKHVSFLKEVVEINTFDFSSSSKVAFLSLSSGGGSYAWKVYVKYLYKLDQCFILLWNSIAIEHVLTFKLSHRLSLL